MKTKAAECFESAKTYARSAARAGTRGFREHWLSEALVLLKQALAMRDSGR